MVLHKVLYGSVYRSDEGVMYEAGEELDLDPETADYLGDKVECIFSMDEFLSQNVGPIEDAILAGEHDDILHDIWNAESDWKQRKTVVGAVRERLEQLQ